MPIDPKFKIPEAVLLPIAYRHRHERLRSDPEKWTTSEVEAIRADCGPDWSHVPIDNIKSQCCNMRKRALLGVLNPKTKNHGASRASQKPGWYAEYLRSPHWREFRQRVLEFWGWSCAICCDDNSLEVHHRTYERLRNEELTDCVPLCRDCHAAATRRADRARANSDALLRFGS